VAQQQQQQQQFGDDEAYNSSADALTAYQKRNNSNNKGTRHRAPTITFLNEGLEDQAAEEPSPLESLQDRFNLLT
jgi:hypothetical protein